MARTSTSSGRRTRANDNENTGNLDPALLAALNQAVATAVAQAVAAIPINQNRNENANDGTNGNETANPPAAHVILERFQKQKPESFRDAPTPINAENWIAHLEKIFDALACTDNQKVRLATYKLEGDAQRWWNALKQAQGDGYVEALAWRDFLDVFYEQYFPVAERDAYRREYLNIRQKSNESITAYMVRFVRMAGIAGAIAGTAVEQAERFKWGLSFEFRRPLINDRFTTVAEVANAARNLELERVDYNSYKSDGSRKRGRDELQGSNLDHQGRFKYGNQRGFGDRSRGVQSGEWQGQRSYHNRGNNNRNNNGKGRWQGHGTYQNRVEGGDLSLQIKELPSLCM